MLKFFLIKKKKKKLFLMSKYAQEFTIIKRPPLNVVLFTILKSPDQRVISHRQALWAYYKSKTAAESPYFILFIISPHYCYMELKKINIFL